MEEIMKVSEIKVEPENFEEIDIKFELEEASTSQDSEVHFPCSDCHLIFSRYVYLMRHKKQKHGIHVDLTKLDEDVDQSTISSEKKKRLEDKNCPICGKVMSSRERVKRHMSTVHTGLRPFECDICLKRFSERGSLKRHLRIHTGLKPFVCKECDKAFNDSSNLKIHMNHHLGIKNYKCTECGKAFRQSGHLTAHMRSHIGERPFMCDICKRQFSSSSQFVQHRKTHDTNVYMVCNECTYKTQDKMKLQRHFVHNHSDVDINDDCAFIASCENCGRMFTQESAKKKHKCYA